MPRGNCTPRIRPQSSRPDPCRWGYPPLNDAFRMGASVNYKEFGPVPLSQGHSLDSIPMEGSGHIYGFAIGHDGNQNRRFAIISPSDTKLPLFFASLDSIRQGDGTPLTRLNDFSAQQQVLQSLLGTDLRSPGAVAQAASRNARKRKAEQVWCTMSLRSSRTMST